jgi:hypothetical protein
MTLNHMHIMESELFHPVLWFLMAPTVLVWRGLGEFIERDLFLTTVNRNGLVSWLIGGEYSSRVKVAEIFMEAGYCVWGGGGGGGAGGGGRWWLMMCRTGKWTEGQQGT